MIAAARSIAPGLEKIRIDNLGATIPYVVKSCILWSTKTCVSFELINIIFTQILWKKFVLFKFLKQFTTVAITFLALDYISLTR